MRKDDWIKSAMVDDKMVAELLMLFKFSSSSSPLPEKKSLDFVFNNKNDNPLIKWGVKKPRSRPLPVYRFIDNNHKSVVVNRFHAKIEADLSSASPTTPLSWSPGTSISGGSGTGGGSGDFNEESSRPFINWHNNSRSNKFITTTGTDIRKSRKRKTFAELKENESFLPKEKAHMNKRTLQSQLRKEIISPREASKKANSSNNQIRNTVEDVYRTPKISRTSRNIFDRKSCEAEKEVVVVSQKSFIALPDLNLPVEEDPGSSDVLYGLS